MYIVHKIHEMWINGNRKDAIRELAKLNHEQVREFLGYLSKEDKGTALILALGYNVGDWGWE